MNFQIRHGLDRLFTLLAGLAALLIVAALVGMLLPMLMRGGSAVVFRATSEFRRLQLEQFQRGGIAAVQAEMTRVGQVRQKAYDILDRFSAGLDTTELQTRVKQLNRNFGTQIANRELSRKQTAALRDLSKELRDELLKAFESTDKAQVRESIKAVLAHAKDPELKDTLAQEYFTIARQYASAVAGVDLTRRPEYAKSLGEVREGLKSLLGPRPGEPLPAIPLEQYGATRWDIAQGHLESILWAETWTSAGAGKALQKSRVPREQQFAGTALAELFPYLRDHASEMLNPRWTFYWQYFTDDSISGHYFGGVGPELLGTLLITVLAIAFALPVGVVAAGYLVECAGDGLATRVLRTCINTLAGVPSIVFGLFGLAFFVIYLLPKAGLREGSSILAGSLTLSLMVLPVIIRASEEAIRTVPRSYKEAALALGASRFRCFVTVILPAAMPGILTGLILSMSRAAGETAPILFTAGVAMGPIPASLAQPTRTLSYSSYDMAVGDKMASLAPHNQFGMVMTLVAIVLLLNVAAIVLRGRMTRKLRGQ